MRGAAASRSKLRDDLRAEERDLARQQTPAEKLKAALELSALCAKLQKAVHAKRDNP
jgi:hypothetical protein